jgi:ankyrin repeat protein
MAIHVACHGGNVELVELLIVQGYSFISYIHMFIFVEGADVNAPGGRGNTPLHFASRSGHMEILRLLIGNCVVIDFFDQLIFPLDNGADVRLENGNGPFTLLPWFIHLTYIKRSNRCGLGYRGRACDA